MVTTSRKGIKEYRFLVDFTFLITLLGRIEVVRRFICVCNMYKHNSKELSENTAKMS